MRFIGFDFDHTGREKQFDCEDSEIATARIGFIAQGRDPDELGLPRPTLEGRAIGAPTAELIVGRNVYILKSLGRVGLSKQMAPIQLAVASGIQALEEAALADIPLRS